jgi:aminoglycoside phosphotransferase (APT) family kinase protein
MPRLIGAESHDTTPILVIEDLSDATWPPPWTPATIDAALAAVAALHATAPPPGLRPMEPGKLGGWAGVAADPAPFLSLGLVGAQWLEATLPALLAAEATPPRASGPCHFDLRSDNIAIRDGQALLLDWAETCLAEPAFDLGAMLPSLAFEGGPPPESILPGRPDIAAKVSGFFAARAGLPDIPDAPFVRRVQREQLSTALPWARRALGL